MEWMEIQGSTINSPMAAPRSKKRPDGSPWSLVDPAASPRHGDVPPMIAIPFSRAPKPGPGERGQGPNFEFGPTGCPGSDSVMDGLCNLDGKLPAS